jgi:hypothetical protein
VKAVGGFLAFFILFVVCLNAPFASRQTTTNSTARETSKQCQSLTLERIKGMPYDPPKNIEFHRGFKYNEKKL